MTFSTAALRASVIVVGIDLTQATDHLIDTVREFARASSGTEVHLVHVAPELSLPESFVGALPSRTREGAPHIAKAYGDLDRYAKELERTTGARVLAHVRAGRAAEQIVSLAAEVDADLIVLEAHGRRGLRRLLHRSLVAQLARSAPCSVLTVRPKENAVLTPLGARAIAATDGPFDGTLGALGTTRR
jgi:nucleotide-binding universal stress UspA family protein